MEDSHDMHHEKGSLSPERSKRRFKTPAQVQALEKFYNEHKYPSESMKSEFAEQIGLSEKQVSGWFCHRRSKDKKLLQDEVYANRNHEFSNGANAIHESTSGLRQESCNSTKQVDGYFDGKEVESNSFRNEKFSPAIPEKRGQPSHVECYSVADERSSGSSSTSYERFIKGGVDNFNKKPRFSFGDENFMLTDTTGAKERGSMISTRSAYVENTAVSLIKMKLGRQYREDGPPLATDFDSLPPGAFDSPIRASNSEPYYVGDSIRPRSGSTRLIVGENKMYDGRRHERMSNGPRPEGSGFNKKLHGSNHWNDSNGCQLMPKTSDIKNNDHVPKRTFMMDEEGKDIVEASFDYSGNNVRSFKYRMVGESDNSLSHSYHLDNLKANASKPLAYPLPDHKYNAPMSQIELYRGRISKPMVKRETNEFLNTGDHVPSRGMLKVLKKKIPKESKYRENCSSACPEMFVTSDTQKPRKAHGKDLMKNSERLLCRKPIIR